MLANKSAQELWHGTRYGMSLDEVRAAVPEARLVRPGAGDSIQWNSGWAPELMRIDNLDVNHEKFSAHFYFADGRLVQVTLACHSRSVSEANLIYNNLLTPLRAKYGRQLTSNLRDTGSLTYRMTDWLHGRTNIRLVLMAMGRTLLALSIIYQVRLAQEADKL